MIGAAFGNGLPWLLTAALALLLAVVLALLGLAQGGAVAGSRYRRAFTRNVGRRLNDLLLFVDAQRLFRWNLVLALLVTTTIRLLTGSWLLTVIGVAGLAMLPNLVLVHLARQRRLRFAGQLPDALMLIAAALRAGASLPLALRQMSLEVAPPCGQEFELMLREQRLGVDFDTALRNMEARLPLQDFVMVVSGMRISREVGGNLADILETLADTLRRKHQMEGKIDALTAQGRMQGIVMTGLPLFLMLILTQMEPEAMAPLYNTWYGWVTLVVVGFLLTIGYVAIRKITSIDV